MTTLKNEPTTAEPRRMRMTGMRIAHSRGGKKLCSGWSESTKGYKTGEEEEPAGQVSMHGEIKTHTGVP